MDGFAKYSTQLHYIQCAKKTALRRYYNELAIRGALLKQIAELREPINELLLRGDEMGKESTYALNSCSSVIASQDGRRVKDLLVMAHFFNYLVVDINRQIAKKSNQLRSLTLELQVTDGKCLKAKKTVDAHTRSLKSLRQERSIIMETIELEETIELSVLLKERSKLKNE